MKKISVILVAVVLLALSACSFSRNKLYDINGNVYVSDNLKIVTEKEKYTSDDTVIRFSITNISNEEHWINPDNACFELHRLVDDEWKCVGTKAEHSWTEMAMLLPSGETDTREINLDEYFYLPLESGEYRISVEGMISNTFEVS